MPSVPEPATIPTASAVNLFYGPEDKRSPRFLRTQVRVLSAIRDLAEQIGEHIPLELLADRAVLSVDQLRRHLRFAHERGDLEVWQPGGIEPGRRYVPTRLRLRAGVLPLLVALAALATPGNRATRRKARATAEKRLRETLRTVTLEQLDTRRRRRRRVASRKRIPFRDRAPVLPAGARHPFEADTGLISCLICGLPAANGRHKT